MDIFDKFLQENSYKFPKGYPDLDDENDVLLLESILQEILEEPFFELNEGKLKPSELEKPYYSSHELAGKYKDRGQRFLEKIINGDEFELEGGNKIIVDPSQSKMVVDLLKKGEYSSLGGGKKLFFDKEGNQYSLSNFTKTAEFGSGSGQGGGSQNTSLQESSQALFCALSYEVKKGPISEEDLTQENFEKAFEYCDVTSTLEEMINFSQEPSWRDSQIKTANILFENIKNPSFKFHRGSTFTDSIYKAFNVGKKEKGIRLTNDKWNPADIWFVDTSIEDFQFSNNLDELNSQLLKLYTENKLIGVSLKKIGNQASFKVVNDPVEKINTQYKGFTSTNKSMSVILLYTDGKIAFRNFNFAGNFAGEIQGKKAAHGKIGMGPLNKILKQYSLDVLVREKILKVKFEENDAALINDFHDAYNNIVENISKDDFIEFLNTKEINWKISKYLGVKLLTEIETLDEEDRNAIISDIVSFASSIIDESSVFVKIF